MEKRADLENPCHYMAGTPNSNMPVKNLVGAFLILIISLSITGFLLTPDIPELFRIAMLSRSIWAWTMAFGGVLLAGFMVAFPIFLIVQGFVCYRASRKTV